jgi:hypothetical protein
LRQLLFQLACRIEVHVPSFRSKLRRKEEKGSGFIIGLSRSAAGPQCALQAHRGDRLSLPARFAIGKRATLLRNASSSPSVCGVATSSSFEQQDEGGVVSLLVKHLLSSVATIVHVLQYPAGVARRGQAMRGIYRHSPFPSTIEA